MLAAPASSVRFLSSPCSLGLASSKPSSSHGGRQPFGSTLYRSCRRGRLIAQWEEDTR